MLKSEKQKYREEIATVFLREYLPQMVKIVTQHMKDADSRIKMGADISSIVGSPIGVELGELKIAKPTNELIDKLVDIHVREIEKSKKQI